MYNMFEDDKSNRLLNNLKNAGISLGKALLTSIAEIVFSSAMLAFVLWGTWHSISTANNWTTVGYFTFFWYIFTPSIIYKTGHGLVLVVSSAMTVLKLRSAIEELNKENSKEDEDEIDFIPLNRNKNSSETNN